MGIKEKLTANYQKNYLKKYGDRLTQAQGKVLSVKMEQKSVLWIFHKMLVTIIVKPERSRNIVKCIYKKNSWFKKPKFISVSQGNSLIIQGLKGKKGKNSRENIEVMNIMNLTTKQQLIASDDNDENLKKIKNAQKIKYRNK
ncbi:hypothetical protein SH2C18_05330 [Clostridium sediminicola]|uniref:hypothetical protein n=1 Tax=Clostridium sediminicola TaxID=3114879 RepID=UPI0031F1E888